MGLCYKVRNLVAKSVISLLTKEHELPEFLLCDFPRFRFEIRPCDVVLVEGRSRISDVIKNITLSRWTHSALYLGRLHDLEDEETRNIAEAHYEGDPKDQLIIEALVGQGTLISPLTKYQYDNLRICRPKDLSPHDAKKVIREAVRYIGTKYHLRQVLDLARFMFPYSILPRRWRSTLFEHNAGDVTRTICSTMLAEAFASVHYPILPVIHRTENNKLKWYRRNTNLLTPSDFDYSPYFDIIKYPFLGDDLAIYRNLPWDKEGVRCTDDDECYLPDNLDKVDVKGGGFG
jgi:hypothetical protein